MDKKTISALIFTLLLVSMLTLVFNVQPAKSDYAWSGNITIRADGSVDPPTAPISTSDSVTYTFTGNIIGSIGIERDNIVLEGNGYALQGGGSGTGIGLTGRTNVTVQNAQIKAFELGITLLVSPSNTISRNNITANYGYYGFGTGISLGDRSSGNIISQNNIINNSRGIVFDFVDSNIISGNNIINNGIGIQLAWSWFNMIYHNSFIDNGQQAYIVGSSSVWDDGYPSGGNYWSDYAGLNLFSGPYQNETGSDGIGDTPYVIDTNNNDRYPLVKPFPWPQHDIGITYVSRVYFDWMPFIIHPLKTVVGQGFPLEFNVFVMNYGNSTETFNVTAYANTTAIQTLTDISLPGRSSAILNFTWDTTGFSYGNYTLSVVADNVPGETDVSDNTRIAGTVHVGIPGDVTGDGYVGTDDIFDIATHFGQEPGHPDWNAIYDIAGDNYVGIDDIFIAAQHFGQEEP